MQAFNGNSRVKAQILQRLNAQLKPEQSNVTPFRAKNRRHESARNVPSQIMALATNQLPDALIRLAADLELSYATIPSRQEWTRAFFESITPGADLSNSWRLFSAWRTRLALASENLKWLWREQLSAVEFVASLLERDNDDLYLWRKALHQTTYAILSIDLADRRRHGLAQTEWHTSAQVLQSLVDDMPETEALKMLPAIASGTAHLAYGIVDPYWKDNLFYIEMHANKILEIMRAAPR